MSDFYFAPSQIDDQKSLRYSCEGRVPTVVRSLPTVTIKNRGIAALRNPA
jgi:hypothetical protein